MEEREREIVRERERERERDGYYSSIYRSPLFAYFVIYFLHGTVCWSAISQIKL